MIPQLAQPTQVNIPNERIAAEFLRVTCDIVPDPLWHFQISLNKSTRLGPPDKTVPQPGGDMISLALFQRESPHFDLEVYGQQLPFEIDPADWLDLWLEKQTATTPMTIVSRLRHNSIGGAVGDVVATWDMNGVAWAGRLFCIKGGNRLLFLWFRVQLEFYNEVADDFLLSLATLKFSDDSPGPLAEKVNWVSSEVPVAWKVPIPLSWKLRTDQPHAGVGSFQADLFDVIASGNTELMGKLSFDLVPADRITEATQAFEVFLGSVKQAGLTVSPHQIQSEPASGAYTESWMMTAPAGVAQDTGVLRCRVLRHPKAWIVAAVYSPTRDRAAWAWMRNKRLLDFISATLEIA